LGKYTTFVAGLKARRSILVQNDGMSISNNRLVRPALVLILAAVLASCGDGGPTSSSGGSSTDNRVVQVNPSYSATIQEIFIRRGCTASACHGTARQAGLDLTTGASYANLVNVRATSEPLVRVIPGDPNGSYLVIKLEGRQSVGSRMPQTGAPLDSIDLTNIRNWISQGALNN
jgi:hypothetical protein